MKYKIKYNYDTGDSFNQYPGEEGELELTWENLDVAKANLKRIEEHYKFYREINGRSWDSNRKREDIVKQYKNEDWYDKNYPEYGIILYADNGNEWRISAPWCGYFESLNYCEIIPDKSDMKFYA